MLDQPKSSNIYFVLSLNVGNEVSTNQIPIIVVHDSSN